MSPELRNRLARERELRARALARHKRRAPIRIAVGLVLGGYRAARDVVRIVWSSGAPAGGG